MNSYEGCQFVFHQPVFKKVALARYYMILTLTVIFSKHQIKAEFKNLNDCEVLSCDFPGLRTSAASMTSTASFNQKYY